MRPNPRVIVTGSRDWVNKLMVIGALNDVYSHYGQFRIVHGGCPTGADKIANDWYWAHGHDRYCTEEPEVFEALWDIEGNNAGPLRNRRMVNAGADLGLAFPLGDSRGTWDCVRKLKAARIPTRIFDLRSTMYRMA